MIHLCFWTFIEDAAWSLLGQYSRHICHLTKATEGPCISLSKAMCSFVLVTAVLSGF